MYYVYRFLDKSGNIIYVGKSKQELEQRFKGHAHLPNECYELTYKIEYIECSTEPDMSIKEIYYINKFRHDGAYFNILDMTDVPVNIEITDKWKQYKGPLPEKFKNSINYRKGYSKQKVIKFNRDGTISQVKPNKRKGESAYVEGFDCKEVDLIINHLIDEINNAENSNQEQIRFRNLVMFVLGINLPLKPSEFLSLKYGELFDNRDEPKAYELTLGRYQQDEVISIPLKSSVKDLLSAYRKKYNFSYKNNAEEAMFLSRKHQIVTLGAWWHILSAASEAESINKNIGSETLRKTFFLNIYHTAEDKLNAILFLSKFSSGMRDASIIRYLNLTSEEIDYDYYFSEEFSIGNMDLNKINCLKNTEAKGE